MSRESRWIIPFVLTLLVAGVMTTLVYLHVRGVNGPSYWFWTWRWMSPPRWYGPMLLAALPMVAAWFVSNRSPSRRALAISLAMTSVVAMKLTSMLVMTYPPGFDHLADIVRSRLATSYYVDATLMADAGDVLKNYPAILQDGGLNLHTLSKPPGPVMYYLAFVRAMGDTRQTAVAAAIGLALLASLSVPATYWLARRICERGAALAAAMLLAVCPGFVIIYPSMDAVYVAIACLMVGTWHAAVAKRDLRWAAMFGLALSLACFASYTLLALGLVLASWLIVLPIVTKQARREDWLRLARVVFVAVAVVVVAYSILKLLTGFDPVTTFRVAWNNQQQLLAVHGHERPWRKTVVWDLLDFFLSFGWAMLVPIAFGLQRVWNDRMTRWFILLCLLQPVIVAVTGLLQTETARVWNFMLPLVILPAAMELAHWPKWARWATLAGMLIVMLAVGHNMTFMQP